MDKLKMQTPNRTDKNFAALAAMFPNAVTETVDENGEVIRAIDADVLAQEVNMHVVSEKEERYQFTWPDKKKSVLLANAPVAATLRPCREDSVNFDTTENLYIEGDNLDVLKLLRETYLNRVKMIYIDPPYNTGKDFVYEDDFAGDTGEFLRRDGQYDKLGNRLTPNLDSNGRFHTDWLNMIYPRLRIARDVLTDDGVIFISIDDNEVENLKKVCNEVFGEGNFIAELPTIMNLKGNQDEFAFAGSHEYTLVYAKCKATSLFNEFSLDDEEAEDWQIDEYGSYKKGANLKATGVNSPREKRPNLWFPIFVKGEQWSLDNFDGSQEIYPITNGEEMSWRWSRDKFLNESYNVIISNDGNAVSIYKKQRPSISEMPSKKPKTLFYKPEYSSGNGTNEIKNLFQGKIFSNPKPVDLIKDFLEISTGNGAIILDFFSGSATTAHAVMQLNAKDGGHRTFIMVQLAEATDKSSEAYKAGYSNICEIGKERIRRAGQKIAANGQYLADKNKNDIPRSPLDPSLDIGFRVLKLDSSNMKDIYYTPQEYAQPQLNLDGLIDNIKDDRTVEDLLFQVMLDLGIPLSARIEVSDKRLANNKKKVSVFFVDPATDSSRPPLTTSSSLPAANHYLIACFETVDNEIVTQIAQNKPYYAVFRDNSFASDSTLVNFEQIFRTYSPATQRRVL